MSDSTLPPEQWRPLFDKIGVEFGYRPFAAHIGMDHTRLRRLLRGGGTSTDAIRQVADGFRVDPSVVRELRGERGQHVEPFTLPDDAGRLNDTERNVVRAMVRALLDAKDSHAADLPAADSPATTEGAEDQTSEEQKINLVNISTEDLTAELAERQYADMQRQAMNSAMNPPTLTEQLEQLVTTVSMLERSATKAHEWDAAMPTNPQLAYSLRKSLDGWQGLISRRPDENERADLLVLLDQARRGIDKFPSEQELRQAIRARGDDPDTEAPLLPREDSNHERRPVNANAPSNGPDRWPDEQPVYNGDDKANWKAWKAAGQPDDWALYRDGRQGDVDLAGGPGAARDLGDEPVGRKIRRRQDEAGELPDADGPEGGA